MAEGAGLVFMFNQQVDDAMGREGSLDHLYQVVILITRVSATACGNERRKTSTTLNEIIRPLVVARSLTSVCGKKKEKRE